MTTANNKGDSMTNYAHTQHGQLGRHLTAEEEAAICRIYRPTNRGKWVSDSARTLNALAGDIEAADRPIEVGDVVRNTHATDEWAQRMEVLWVGAGRIGRLYALVRDGDGDFGTYAVSTLTRVDPTEGPRP